jgi:hypothetical protein
MSWWGGSFNPLNWTAWGKPKTAKPDVHGAHTPRMNEAGEYVHPEEGYAFPEGLFYDVGGNMPYTARTIKNIPNPLQTRVYGKRSVGGRGKGKGKKGKKSIKGINFML